MKKLCFLIFIVLVGAHVVWGQRGDNVNINKMRLNGMIYNDKSGVTDTLAAPHPDSLGMFKIMNVADPVNPTDAVNLRTMIGAGITGWDSIPFTPENGNIDAYLSGVVTYTTNLDGRYFLMSDSLTKIVTLSQLQDSITVLNEKINTNMNPTVYTINLPYASTVAGRVAGAVEGTDYPSGWVLAAGSSPIDLDITHNLNRRVASVSVFAVTGTQEQQLFNTAAYNGIITPTVNSLRIQSLATVTKAIKIYIVFAQ